MKFRKRVYITLTARPVIEFEVLDKKLEGLNEDDRDGVVMEHLYAAAYNLTAPEIVKGEIVDCRLEDEMLMEDVEIPPLEQLAEAAE